MYPKGTYRSLKAIHMNRLVSVTKEDSKRLVFCLRLLWSQVAPSKSQLQIGDSRLKNSHL